MDMKDIITKIKTFLSDEIIKMIDVKTIDGVILNYETLEIGKELYIVDESGVNTAPDDTYTLDDGTIIISVDGLISEITLPETPEVETPEVETPEVEMETSKFLERLEKLEQENIEIKEILVQLAENLSKSNFNSELKKIDIKKTENLSIVDNDIYKNKNENQVLNNIFKNMYKK